MTAPNPGETTQDKTILSGAVSGSAQLVIKAGAVTYTFIEHQEPPKS